MTSCIYHSVLGKCPLPGKRPCNCFSGSNGKCPLLGKRPGNVSRDRSDHSRELFTEYSLILKICYFLCWNYSPTCTCMWATLLYTQECCRVDVGTNHVQTSPRGSIIMWNYFVCNMYTCRWLSSAHFHPQWKKKIYMYLYHGCNILTNQIAP